MAIKSSIQSFLKFPTLLSSTSSPPSEAILSKNTHQRQEQDIEHRNTMQPLTEITPIAPSTVDNLPTPIAATDLNALDGVPTEGPDIAELATVESNRHSQEPKASVLASLPPPRWKCCHCGNVFFYNRAICYCLHSRCGMCRTAPIYRSGNGGGGLAEVD